jgi:hypothetical protein
MLGRVGVSGADVFVLQCFELLLGAELVGLEWVLVAAGDLVREGGLTILVLFLGEEVAMGGRFDVSFWVRCAGL